MQEFMLIASVALIHLMAVMSPGPDFLIVVKNSLSYSRKVGIWTSIGIGLGIMVHIFYSFIGLGLLISQSVVLFSIIKYLGAIYLVFLGFKSFVTRSSKVDYAGEVGESLPVGKLKALSIGFLTNVLNPKATLFFLSLFTLVISPNTPDGVMTIISILLVFDTTLWFILLSILITQRRIRLLFNKYQNTFNRIFGGFLIAIGVKIALS